MGKVAPAAAKALPEGIPTPGLPQKAKQAVEAIKAATPEAPKLPSGIPIPGLPSKVRVCAAPDADAAGQVATCGPQLQPRKQQHCGQLTVAVAADLCCNTACYGCIWLVFPFQTPLTRQLRRLLCRRR